MDSLDLPNLHARSFALARWWLREKLFGLGEAAPEIMAPGRRLGLIAFGFGTWLYRLVLFLGIAVLVYHFFVKAIGVLLFVVEIGWFLAMPVAMEVKEWWKRRAAIAVNPRSRRLGWVLGGLLLLGLVPWQAQVSAPALLKAGGHSGIFTAIPGRLERLEVVDGQQVAKGQVLAVLSSPDLEYQLASQRARNAVLEYEMSSVAFDPSFRERAQVLDQQLGGAVAAQLGLEREAAKLVVTADAAGRVVDLDPELRPGQWLPDKTRLMGVADPAGAQIEALVDEHALDRLKAGNTCTFHPDDPSWPVLPCRVAVVDKVGSSLLSLPQLADLNGGPIAVRAGDHVLAAEKAHYRLRLDVLEPYAPMMEVRGTAIIDGERASLLWGVLRQALAVLVREFGI